ncbi:hypothetical protein [Mesorhizobium sp. A556]
MKNPFQKETAISKIEKQIAQFEAQRAELEKKKTIVEQLLAEHKTTMRAFVRDNPTLDPPAELRHPVSIARDHLEAITESMTEADEQLIELRSALISARDQAERDTAADADEALADFVDREFAPAIATATAAISKACTAYLARMPEGLAVVESRPWARPLGHPRSNADRYNRNEILAAILAESLFAAAPDAFEAQDSARGRTHILQRLFSLDQTVPQTFVEEALPAAARNPAKLLLSDRLRARAAAKRAGTPAAVDRAPEPEPTPQPPRPGLEDVEVFATKHFAYQADEFGTPIICGRRWVHNVPSLAADAAVAAEVALRTDTPEGKDAFDAEKEYRRQSGSTGDHFIELEGCVNLGDPCNFLGRDGELAAAE